MNPNCHKLHLDTLQIYLSLHAMASRVISRGSTLSLV
jgi:hypothetical protein